MKPIFANLRILRPLCLFKSSKFNEEEFLNIIFANWSRGGGGCNLHMSQYGDVPLFCVLFGVAPGFLGTFLGYSRIFGYHFLAIPGFLGIIFGKI